jgi:hypothetical protein
LIHREFRGGFLPFAAPSTGAFVEICPKGYAEMPHVGGGARSSFRRPSTKARSAGNKRHPGRLFFGYFLLATQKKVSRPSVREPTLKQPSRQRHNKNTYSMPTKQKIKLLADQYADKLTKAIDNRVAEMRADDVSHYLIYRVLGIQETEGHLIDVYQNKGRFLYKYAGSFLEETSKLCFKEAFPNSGSLRITNTRGQRPKTFEIDCLVGNDALEIKYNRR